MNNNNNNKLYLFQLQLTKEQIDQWTPLSSTICDPKSMNCGPTALNLMNVLPRDKSETLGYQVSQTGIQIKQMQDVIMQQINRLQIEEGKKLQINELFPILNNELNNGNITILFLFHNQALGENHIVTIARDLNGQFILFDGQQSKFYSGNKIDDYLNNNYEYFQCFYTFNKNKRMLNDIISPIVKNKSLESSQKRQRIIGGKIKRKSKKRVYKSKSIKAGKTRKASKSSSKKSSKNKK